MRRGAGRPADRPTWSTSGRSSSGNGRGQRPGIVESHLDFRFGMHGFGLIGQPEFGLSLVSAESVGAWARERFGRANVMAFLTGAPPSDLHFALGDGAAFPIPRPEPEPSDPLPSHVMTPGDGVALGFLRRGSIGAGTFLTPLPPDAPAATAPRARADLRRDRRLPAARWRIGRRAGRWRMRRGARPGSRGHRARRARSARSTARSTRPTGRGAG